MILERLENALKPTPFRTILESVFGGKTVTQLTCAQCKYVRNKEETFFNLSLPIKNQKTLSECFEKFISGEVISDYRCDGCEKKVDVTKR
jgi:ubiquitin carboxyl-terminal hydrolase 34